MDEPNINLGKLLFEMRTEKGLSLREFSERLNISHAYLSKLEKGIDPRTGKEVTPTIETLAKISAGIGMKLTDLIEGSGYSDAPDDDGRPVSLEGLADEFLDVIYGTDKLSHDGKILECSKNEIIELAIKEISKRIKK